MQNRSLSASLHVQIYKLAAAIWLQSHPATIFAVTELVGQAHSCTWSSTAKVPFYHLSFSPSTNWRWVNEDKCVLPLGGGKSIIVTDVRFHAVMKYYREEKCLLQRAGLVASWYSSSALN